MRTRTYNNPGTQHTGSENQWKLVTGFWIFVQTLSNTGFISSMPSELTESIVDELPLRQRSGYCSHSKTTYSIPDIGLTWYWVNSSNGLTYRSDFTAGYLYRKFCTALSGGFGTGFATQFVPTLVVGAFDRANASYEAVKKMRPSIDEMLAVNFALELAEMGVEAKHCLHRALSRRAQAEALAKKAKSRFRPPGGGGFSAFLDALSGTGRGLGRRAAKANLLYQFVIKPTISDASNLLRIITEMQKKLSKLIDEAGKLQRRHYSRPVDNLVSLPADVWRGPYGFNSLNSWVNIHHEWVTRPKYCASMLFTYDASALRGAQGVVSYLLHALGVDRPASIIWERIPYSFVVDWFVNVGDMIAGIEDRFNDPLPIVIHDFSHSLKYEYRARASWYNGTQTNFMADLCYANKKSYTRWAERPCLYDQLSVHTPNLNQWGLGGSLIILRMDGINKR